MEPELEVPADALLQGTVVITYGWDAQRRFCYLASIDGDARTDVVWVSHERAILNHWLHATKPS